MTLPLPLGVKWAEEERKRRNNMSAGYNLRCVKGSEESRQKAKMTKENLEDAQAEADMNNFIDAQDKADEEYWDSVIQW